MSPQRARAVPSSLGQSPAAIRQSAEILLSCRQQWLLRRYPCLRCTTSVRAPVETRRKYSGERKVGFRKPLPLQYVCYHKLVAAAGHVRTQGRRIKSCLWAFVGAKDNGSGVRQWEQNAITQQVKQTVSRFSADNTECRKHYCISVSVQTVLLLKNRSLRQAQNSGYCKERARIDRRFCVERQAKFSREGYRRGACSIIVMSSVLHLILVSRCLTPPEQHTAESVDFTKHEVAIMFTTNYRLCSWLPPSRTSSIFPTVAHKLMVFHFSHLGPYSY